VAGGSERPARVWIEALTERAASRAQMPGLRPRAWAKGPGLDNSVAVVPALGRPARVSMWRRPGRWRHQEGRARGVSLREVARRSEGAGRPGLISSEFRRSNRKRSRALAVDDHIFIFR
jgi:hypothetical protein